MCIQAVHKKGQSPGTRFGFFPSCPSGFGAGFTYAVKRSIPRNLSLNYDTNEGLLWLPSLKRSTSPEENEDQPKKEMVPDGQVYTRITTSNLQTYSHLSQLTRHQNSTGLKCLTQPQTPKPNSLNPRIEKPQLQASEPKTINCGLQLARLSLPGHSPRAATEISWSLLRVGCFRDSLFGR